MKLLKSGFIEVTRSAEITAKTAVRIFRYFMRDNLHYILIKYSLKNFWRTRESGGVEDKLDLNLE
jgi:hypothetical protein